jgi:hypothetical protein
MYHSSVPAIIKELTKQVDYLYHTSFILSGTDCFSPHMSQVCVAAHCMYLVYC